MSRVSYLNLLLSFPKAKGGNSLQKGKMACKIFYLSLTLHFLSENYQKHHDYRNRCGVIDESS